MSPFCRDRLVARVTTPEPHEAMPRVLLVAQWSFPPDWHLSLHAHDGFNQTLIILGGQIRSRFRGETIARGPGYVLCYPRGTPHEEWSDSNGPLRMICIDWTEGWGLDPIGLSLTAADRRGRIESAMRWMLELSENSLQSDLTRDALMHTLLSEYAHHVPSESDAMLLRVRGFIREHISEPITLNDLAESAFMSRYHFAHTFSHASGQTPMGFLRRLRMEAARDLLVTTPLSLRKIASQVGFADEFHFSRVFKQVIGVAPTALRDAKSPRH